MHPTKQLCPGRLRKRSELSGRQALEAARLDQWFVTHMLQSDHRHEDLAKMLDWAEGVIASGQTAPTKELASVNIQFAGRREFEAIIDIEQVSFEFPWSREDFIRCASSGRPIKVAMRGDRVLGYMVYELHKTRYHLLNLAVESGARRAGVGLQLIADLWGHLSVVRNRITAEVRETNLAAQLFFRALDFRAISVLADYYADTPEDAYIFQYRA